MRPIFTIVLLLLISSCSMGRLRFVKHNSVQQIVLVDEDEQIPETGTTPVLSLSSRFKTVIEIG